MRSHNSSNPKGATRRTLRGRLRLLASAQSGFTIIEVVVSAVIITSLAGATATALIATARTSGDQRNRSQAAALAQQDQERLRGMSIVDLSRLNETRTLGPYNGTSYSVTSTGNYLSSTGGDTCASSGVGAAAYVKIRSEVDWAANHVDNNLTGALRRPKVVEEALITPQIGGTLVTPVKDQLNNPLSGAAVNAAGADWVSGTTDSQGCTIFNSMTTGDYYHWVTKSGYVDPDGNVQTTRGVSVSGSGTTFAPAFKFGQAGTISNWFKATIGGTSYLSRSPSVSWSSPGMAMSKKNLVAATGSPAKVIPADLINISNVYPYSFTNGTGTYTDNYTVWSGNCDVAMPTAPADQSRATLTPGGWAILLDGAGNQPRIKQPGLNLNVRWKPTAAGALTAVPQTQVAAVKMTHQSCNQTWWPEPGAITPDPPGVLKYPGQPFAPDVNGQRLSICVDYTRNGGTSYFHNDAALVTRNDNFSVGTTVNVDVDESLAANAGRCV